MASGTDGAALESLRRDQFYRDMAAAESALGVVAAGVVAGLFLARRHPLLGLESAALYGGLAGLFGGTGVAVLAAVSGGAAGPGRMADFGPSAAQVALVAVITLTIAGALSAAAVPALREWRRRRQVGVAPAPR